MTNGSKGTRRARRSKKPKTSRTSQAGKTGTIRDFIGLLAGKTKKIATIEEMNEAAADGWAGKVKMS